MRLHVNALTRSFAHRQVETLHRFDHEQTVIGRPRERHKIDNCHLPSVAQPNELARLNIDGIVGLSRVGAIPPMQAIREHALLLP